MKNKTVEPKKPEPTQLAVLLLPYPTIQLIAQTLAELPAKISMPVIQDISTQIDNLAKEPAKVAETIIRLLEPLRAKQKMKSRPK